MVLAENALLESTDADGRPVVHRLLFIDLRASEAALIDVQDSHAWPEWESFGTVEARLASGAMRVRDDDPWYADLRADAELSLASRKTRDERLAVIRPLVAREVDGDQQILRASFRGRLVHEAHVATGKAEDKIYRWLRQFWQRGQIDNALLPDFGACGRRKDGQPRTVGPKKRGAPSRLARAEPGREGMNVTEEVCVLLVRGGTRYWKRKVNGKRLSLRDAFERTLQTYFHKRLEWRDGRLVPVVWEGPDDDQRLPTFRQFCYWLGKERERDADLKARWGGRTWALKHRPVLGSSEHLSTGPGDLYLIDATVADLYLVSALDPRWVIGRPVLYLVVDHFTRMIAGLYAGLEGPSWLGAMMALENALTEKVSYCATYGVEIEEEDWPCHLVPRQLTGDRGEMIGAPSDGLVPGFRMTVSNTPPFRADFKSYVEGQFKITNERGIKRMPGWVDKARDRGDPDYRLDARLTLHDFTRLMIELALHNNKRRRLETQLPVGYPLPRNMDPRPLDLWEWGTVHRLGCGREFPRDRVRANLLPTVTATATRHGFSIYNGLVHFDSATAREQGWFTGGGGKRAVRKELSLDERDISRAFLRLDGGRRIEECPLTAKDMLRYYGKSLADVMDERDRFKIAREDDRGRRHQEEAEHQARLEALTAAAVEARRDVLGDTEVAPLVSDVRGRRHQERDHHRRAQAFSRDDGFVATEPSSPDEPLRFRGGGVVGRIGTDGAPIVDDDDYVPFPS